MYILLISMNILLAQTPSTPFEDFAKKRGFTLPKGQATVMACVEVGPVVIPTTDLPTDAEKKEILATHPEIPCFAYRFGLGVAKDYVKYRKCHLSIGESNNRDNDSLAEIYANGWGVKRDYKLAIALVCNFQGSPMELESVVETLAKMSSGEIKEEFNFCSHAISTGTTMNCNYLHQSIEQRKKMLVYEDLWKNWNASEKEAFQTFMKVADDYQQHKAESEQEEKSGSLFPSIVAGTQDELEKSLMTSLKAFEAKKFPTDQDFKKADTELNQVYKKVIGLKFQKDWGMIKKDDIVSTQRKWIKYRDAWVTFAAIRYPAVNQEIWQTWLTKERINQLREIISFLE